MEIYFHLFARPGHQSELWWRQKPGVTEAKSVTIFLSLVNNVICFSPIFFPLFLASEIGPSLSLPVPCQKLDKWYKPMNTTFLKRFPLTRGLRMCAEFFRLYIISSSMGMFFKWFMKILQNNMYLIDTTRLFLFFICPKLSVTPGPWARLTFLCSCNFISARPLLGSSGQDQEMFLERVKINYLPVAAPARRAGSIPLGY